MEYKIDYIYDYSDDHSFISLPEFVTDKYGRKIKLTKFISNIGNLYKNRNIDEFLSDELINKSSIFISHRNRMHHFISIVYFII